MYHIQITEERKRKKRERERKKFTRKQPLYNYVVYGTDFTMSEFVIVERKLKEL